MTAWGVRRDLAALCVAVLAGAGSVFAPEAAARGDRALTAAEYAELSAAFEAIAPRLERFSGRALAAALPDRVVARRAALEGVSPSAYRAREAERIEAQGYGVRAMRVTSPTPGMAVFETGAVLCVVLPFSYERGVGAERRVVEGDLLAIRDGGPWTFMTAARGPLRKVQIRRVYGEFICSR